MMGFAYAVMGCRALLAPLGFFLIFIPLIGVPLIAVGGFILWCGQLLRHKARELAVNRQLGG